MAVFARFSGTPALGLASSYLLWTLGAFGEETGWRGFALPLLQRRFSPITASMIVTAVWFVWHVPLFFVIDTYRSFPPVGYIGMFLGLGCGAIILTWLYNRSGGSILLGILEVLARRRGAPSPMRP